MIWLKIQALLLFIAFGWLKTQLAAVTAFWYANGLKHMAQAAGLDFDTNVIKVMLTTVTYVPNQDTHEFKSSVTNEVVGTGYTAGGATLASKTITQTNNVIALDAADTSWPASTITARRAVMYDDSGATDTAKVLILWVDFGQDEISSNGNFTIQWNAAGIATLTAADAVGFP